MRTSDFQVAVIGAGLQAVRYARANASEPSKLVVVGTTAAAVTHLVRPPVGPYLPLALLVGVCLFIEYQRVVTTHQTGPPGPKSPFPPGQA